VDKVFLHYFQNMSSLSGTSLPDHTGALPLDPAGVLALILPTPGKNPAGAYGLGSSQILSVDLATASRRTSAETGGEGWKRRDEKGMEEGKEVEMKEDPADGEG